MVWGYWELILFRGLPSASDGRLHLLRGNASRDIDRSRRSWSRSQASPIAEEPGPITLKGGTFSQVPSGDGNVPDLPSLKSHLVLSLRPPVGSLEFPWTCDGSQGRGKRAPGSQTPKRMGDELDAPSPQRPRTDSQREPAAGDEGFHERPGVRGQAAVRG